MRIRNKSNSISLPEVRQCLEWLDWAAARTGGRAGTQGRPLVRDTTGAAGARGTKETMESRGTTEMTTGAVSTGPAARAGARTGIAGPWSAETLPLGSESCWCGRDCSEESGPGLCFLFPVVVATPEGEKVLDTCRAVAAELSSLLFLAVVAVSGKLGTCRAAGSAVTRAWAGGWAWAWAWRWNNIYESESVGRQDQGQHLRIT